MTGFSAIVRSSWPAPRPDADDLLVVVDESLPENRALQVFVPTDGGGTVTLTPAHAHRLGLTGGATLTPDALGSLLADAALQLNGADALHYLPVAEHATLRLEPLPPTTRLLTADDAAAFAAFEAEAPDDDRDEAFVELDHRLVVGSFVDGRLVSAASAYPWAHTRFADLGVLTLPEFRGRGFGRTTVRALAAAALQRDHEPQYRCQLDNVPSVALARASGFATLGTWDVLATD